MGCGNTAALFLALCFSSPVFPTGPRTFWGVSLGSTRPIIVCWDKRGTCIGAQGLVWLGGLYRANGRGEKWCREGCFLGGIGCGRGGRSFLECCWSEGAERGGAGGTAVCWREVLKVEKACKEI